MRLVFGVLLLVGCTGLPTETSTGVGDMPRSSAGLFCRPGSHYCDENQLVTCDQRGQPALNPTDCLTIGSATNPGVCDSSSLSCRLSRPYFEWQFFLPSEFSGSHMTVDPQDGFVASPPPQSGNFAVSWKSGSAGEGDISAVSVTLDRSALRPSTLYSLPNPAIKVATTSADGSVCTSWSSPPNTTYNEYGLRWFSDVPSWMVGLYATCDTNPSLALNVLLSGSY